MNVAERTKIVNELERYSLTQAYSVPLLWWQRIIVNHKKIKGWHMTPSHYLWQDLADVWLTVVSVKRPAAPHVRRRPSVGFGSTDDLVHHSPSAAGDPHADRRGGGRVLPDPRHAGRRGGGEAQGRRRQRLRRDDPGRAQAARARQAALRAVRRLHDRPGALRSRQVAVDRRVRQQGDRAARAGVVADRADGQHHRRADRHSARHHIGALPRYLDRPQRARAGRVGARHTLVLARHAHHPDAADAVQLAAEDRLRVDLARTRSPTCR